MKFKRALCCVAAAFLLPALFAGCGGGGDNSGIPSGPAKPVDNGDLVFDNDNNIVYSGVKLKMWSVTTGDDAQTQNEIVAEFNELYNGMINVEVTHTSRYDLENLLETTMQFDRGSAPDIFFSHGSRAATYADKGWILPIEPYVDKAGLAIDKDDYVESLLSATTVNGNIYGLPQDVHSAMIVYRKDILEKNNLKVPANYLELVDVCEQAIDLAKEGNLWVRGEKSGYVTTEWRKAPSSETYNPFPIAFGDMWVHEFLSYTAAAQNGGEFVNSKGLPAWNTTEVANGIQVLKDFIMPEQNQNSTNKYPLSKQYGSDYDVGNVPVKAGDSIFKLLGPWEYPKDLVDYDRLFADDGGAAANLGTMSTSYMFAKDPTAEYANKIKGEGHAFMLMSTVTSRTKQCAAMVFADWMVNNAGVKWAERGHLPALKSVESSSDYRNSASYNSYIKNWGSCDDYIVIQPTVNYQYVDDYYKHCVQKAMADQYKTTSIKSIMNEEYQDCMDYIELYA